MDEGGMDELKSDGWGGSDDKVDEGEVRGETGDMMVRPSTRVCRPVLLPLLLVLIVVVLLAILRAGSWGGGGRDVVGGGGGGGCSGSGGSGGGGGGAQSCCRICIYLFVPVFILFFLVEILFLSFSYALRPGEDGWARRRKRREPCSEQQPQRPRFAIRSQP